MIPLLLLGLGAALPPGSAATPSLPVAPRPAVATAGRIATPTTLFINYDGAVLGRGCGNDAKRDCSELIDQFGGYVGPFTGNLTQKLAVLQATRKDVADFGIRVVMERPADDVDYTMVLYGELGAQSFAGIAPYIDCGDAWPGDTSFAGGFGESNTGSAIVLQEAAHTWGLEHVDAPNDILHPFKDSVQNPSFQDECFKIVANTELEPVGGVCNAIHTQYCDTGWQNSWREMMRLFGPTVPDTQAPTLELLWPELDSYHVLPVTIPLLGIVDDDLQPQAYQMEITGVGAPFSQEVTGLDPLLANFDNPPAGAYVLEIALTDEAGNATRVPVRFTVLPEGSEIPEGAQEPESPLPSLATGCVVGGESQQGAERWAWVVPALRLRRRADRGKRSRHAR